MSHFLGERKDGSKWTTTSSEGRAKSQRESFQGAGLGPNQRKGNLYLAYFPSFKQKHLLQLCYPSNTLLCYLFHKFLDQSRGITPKQSHLEGLIYTCTSFRCWDPEFWADAIIRRDFGSPERRVSVFCTLSGCKLCWPEGWLW